eukprot:4648215-Alexandrium_andersonii.AAC.1
MNRPWTRASQERPQNRWCTRDIHVRNRLNTIAHTYANAWFDKKAPRQCQLIHAVTARYHPRHDMACQLAIGDW